MRDAGRVVPRRQLVHELWGTVRDTKSLDVQVGRLRHRLAEIEGVQRIVTVRGVGFRFLTDEALADEQLLRSGLAGELAGATCSSNLHLPDVDDQD